MLKSGKSPASARGAVTCWWSCSGAEILAQFTAGMMGRINQGIPYSARGMA